MKYIDGSPNLCESVYRIYAYDPGKGGWWCLSFLGDHKTQAGAEVAHPEIHLTDIAISNIKYNDWDCLWIEEYGKLWPFDEDDKMV